MENKPVKTGKQMNHYQFSNVEITDQFISADVYKNSNYVFKIGAEILHLEYTQDITDTLYKEFREFALDYLYYNNFVPNIPTNIINICQFINKKDKSAHLECP